MLEGKIKLKEQEIQGMLDRVANAEKRCEESLREHQRRTREIEQQFADKEKLLQDNLRK